MARPPSDIAARIVRAARDRFCEHGVDGASLRQIARDADTNIGMVYYYFETKDELFLAAIEDIYVVLARDIGDALGAEGPTDARLRALYLRLSAMSDEEAQVMQLIMREALVSSERLQRVAARFEAGHLPRVVRFVTEAIAEGSYRADVHPLALMVATFVLGVIPQLAHRKISASQLPLSSQLPSREASAEALLSVLLKGVGGPRLRPNDDDDGP